MTVKVNPFGKRLAWHTCKIPQDGVLEDLRVQFEIFSVDESRKRTREALTRVKAVAKNTEGMSEDQKRLAGIDFAIDRLSDEDAQRMRDDLSGRIVAWELKDLDGNDLPVTDENVNAILYHPAFLKPLHDGLDAASSGAIAKN